ncbi:M23 family metallopeptidase [Microbacterium phosphatis]|uniref:M23 family metallopeptidase n=1 Tax=Microbacterium phosphatis TaxID=3140248 RepID=UPI0031401EB0
MAVDLNNLDVIVGEIFYRLSRLESGSMLENAAIDRGALTVKSEEGLRVGTPEDPTGSAFVYGVLKILGQLLLEGDMDVTGGGKITVGGVVIEPLGGGRIKIGSNIVLDAATRTISIGAGIKITATSAGAAKIEVGTGADKVVLDSSFETPRINFGSAQISSATGETFTFGMGTDVVYFVDGTIRIPGWPSPPANATGLQYAVIDSLGRVWAAPAGGPTPGDGGDPGSPGEPGDNPAGYVYPVDPSRWTVSNTFAQHVARSSQEPGIDWATSWGTPIWAPGDGTIVDVKPTNTEATGRYVTLVTTAGDWFRFLHLSSFPVGVGQTVTRGAVIGYSGGSGKGSDAGYGLHVHVSFKRGYTGAGWPGASALDDLLAYMAETA